MKQVAIHDLWPWHAWHACLCMLEHMTFEKNPANKTLFIRTKYFEKVSGFFLRVFRVGILSGRIKSQVVQTEYF